MVDAFFVRRGAGDDLAFVHPRTTPPLGGDLPLSLGLFAVVWLRDEEATAPRTREPCGFSFFRKGLMGLRRAWRVVRPHGKPGAGCANTPCTDLMYIAAD